jgi:hypothetical protein
MMEFIISQKFTNGKKDTCSLLCPRLGFAGFFVFLTLFFLIPSLKFLLSLAYTIIPNLFRKVSNNKINYIYIYITFFFSGLFLVVEGM